MNVLDYSWNTATNISQRDYESLRLILDERLASPVLSGDAKGFVIKLPIPEIVEEKFYRIHGLYADQDEKGWDTVWRCFRASLYHLSLHAAFSDFKRYSGWARGKDTPAATFSVCLVEDLNIANEAKAKWTGVLADLAYANYVSALRISPPDEIGDSSLRVATKLMLAAAGVFRSSGERLYKEEDGEVRAAAERARAKVEEAGARPLEERGAIMAEAAREVYSAVLAEGPLHEIPYMPFTDAHGPCDLFQPNLTERGRSGGQSLLASALARVGLGEDTSADDPVFLAEAREVLASMEASAARLAKTKGAYEKLISPTRLDDVEFPLGDFAAYQRVRTTLAGPIKNVRDQLSLVKNVMDDVGGYESGQQVDTQAAMQVLASGQKRSDVFEQLQLTYKEEAWVILIDASKSVASFAHETKGIATCLAEVAAKLISNQNQWAMYSFNNSFQVIKDFEETYGMVPRSRIGGVVQRNATFLPDAIQVAHKCLAKKEASVRILVVVSDGYAAGYNGIEEKLASVMKDVEKAGVFVVGVGVDSATMKQYVSLNCKLGTPYETMKTFAKAYFELSYMF